jgi:hypothetical protein
LYGGSSGIERERELCNVLASAAREVGASATFSTNEWRDGLDDFSGRNPTC